MDNVLTLIAPILMKNALGDYVQTGETSRDVFGTINSVSRAEWYDAGRKGMNPEIVFTTPLINYCHETEAELHGVRYGIYRTYLVQDSDEIELYLERKAGVQ
jgi:hypothetical protein